MMSAFNTDNFEAITAGAIDGTLNSSPIYAQGILYASVQAVSGGTINGTLKLYGSNDRGTQTPGLGTPSVSNWYELGSKTVTASGDSLALAEFSYRWLKVNWTDSASGAGATGTFTVTVKGW